MGIFVVAARRSSVLRSSAISGKKRGKERPHRTAGGNISSGRWEAASPTSGKRTVNICAAGSGVADLLMDAGPFVALLDRGERNHEQCVAFFREFRGRLITTEAVLTEAVYLLGPSFARQKPALEFVLASGADLVPRTSALLKRCAHLMSKYSDVPMDYADATLVAVADALGIRDVLTLDRRGFSVYRYASRGSFRIYPDK